MDPSCPAQSLVGPLDLYVPVAISHTQIFLSQDDVANFLSSLVISQFDTMLICPLEKQHILNVQVQSILVVPW